MRGTLKVNVDEAKTVRLLFELYLKLGSVRRLHAECQRRGLRTKLRTMLDGRQSGGIAFSHGHLYLILSNPLYIGRIPHKGRSYEGQHEAIIDPETWNKVQAQFAANAGRKRGRLNAKHPSLLAGLLFTAEGVPFTPSHAVNHGRRYRYYVERPLIKSEAAKKDKPDHQADGHDTAFRSKGWRLPAHEIERLVLSQLAAFLRDRGKVLSALPSKKSPDTVSAALTRAAKLADACETGSPAGQAEIVPALVGRVTVGEDNVTIETERKVLAARLLDQVAAPVSEAKSRDAITLEVPVRFRRRGVEAKLVVRDQRAFASGPDPSLVKALSRAHKWFGQIVRGEAEGVGAIAREERLDRGYVTRVVCLAFLAPNVVKAILEGQQPTAMTSRRLMKATTGVPILWSNQSDWAAKWGDPPSGQFHDSI